MHTEIVKIICEIEIHIEVSHDEKKEFDMNDYSLKTDNLTFCDKRVKCNYSNITSVTEEL